MEQLSLWVGAGLVTAGVSAALLAGAAVADASTSGLEPAGAVPAGSVSAGSRVDIVTARGTAHGVAIDRSPAGLSWLAHELQDAVGAFMASPVFDPPAAARVVAPRRPEEAGPVLALAV